MLVCMDQHTKYSLYYTENDLLNVRVGLRSHCLIFFLILTWNSRLNGTQVERYMLFNWNTIHEAVRTWIVSHLQERWNFVWIDRWGMIRGYRSASFSVISKKAWQLTNMECKLTFYLCYLSTHLKYGDCGNTSHYSFLFLEHVWTIQVMGLD